MADSALPEDALVAIAKALDLINRWTQEPGRSWADRAEGVEVALELLAVVDPEGLRDLLLPRLPEAVDRILELSPQEGRAHFERLTPEQQAQVLDRMLRRGEAAD